ncbi:TRAF-like family protein [Theobroma cacao]|uniref:TRAF-like family protein n=1 Tax=Theobroma cacao TaxID=3641 RepID=A0A061DVF4_THECC|nr:TRAF-like family protein [Theobroma cacao]
MSMSTSKFIRKVSNSLSWCQAKASTSRDRSGKVEEIDYYSPPAPFANNPAPLANHSGITRVIRDLPPAHYSFKVESFTIFAETGLEEKFESGVFEAGGYKWRLLLYPKGNKKSNGGDCISLYLQIAETEKLPPAWEVNVSFRLFVFDQIRDKYLTIEDNGAVKRFHQMKTEWGFDQLLFLESFNDPSNGYLVDDSCVFGAEVFVTEQTRKLERIRVYPKGTGRAKGTALSLYLGFYQQSDALSGRSLYVKFKLCLMDQIVSNYKKITEGLTVEGILENWSKLKPVIMEEWNENRVALIYLLERLGMDKDWATWIGADSQSLWANRAQDRRWKL